MVRADTVWLQPARFDKGTQVVDAASRRAADELVFRDAQRETVGIVDRLLNQKVSSRLTQLLLVHLPVVPALVTLLAGFVGLYGALLVAGGTWQGVVTGFAILEGYAILDGCAGDLARVRLHQTALGRLVRHGARRLRQRGDDPRGGPGALAARRNLSRHEDVTGGGGDDAVSTRWSPTASSYARARAT